MTVTTRVIPTSPEIPYPLGRHVDHDEASRAFAYEITAPTPTAPILWQHHGPVLDQGNLGSCTGNAMEQCLATGPLYRAGFTPTEQQALQIYELATHLDSVPGSYPPDDTGSSGLGVCKAAKKLGLITAYKHVFGITHARQAIQTTPFCVGSEWTEGMFTPDGFGYIHPTGSVAGGHEYMAMGWDPGPDVWTFLQSWGDAWGGYHGVFRMHGPDFASLLANQGDIVVPVR